MRVAIWVGLFVMLITAATLGLMQAASLESKEQPSWLLFVLFGLGGVCLICKTIFDQSKLDFWEKRFVDGAITFEQMQVVQRQVDRQHNKSAGLLFVSLGIMAGFYLTFVNPQNPTEVGLKAFGAHISAKTDLPALVLLLVSLVLLARLADDRMSPGADQMKLAGRINK